MNYMILAAIVLPILAGGILLFLPEKFLADRAGLLKVAGVSFVVCALLAVCVISGVAGSQLMLFRLVDEIPVYFAIDDLGRIFAGIVVLVFLMAGFFSFIYMSHEKNEKRYYGFYLITFGVLMGLCFSGNLVTLYLFYEFMTLVSMPLVIHTGSREAVMAALKYLFYSFCGAYMALFGMYFLYKYAYWEPWRDLYIPWLCHPMVAFVPGGSIEVEAVVQS